MNSAAKLRWVEIGAQGPVMRFNAKKIGARNTKARSAAKTPQKII